MQAIKYRWNIVNGKYEPFLFGFENNEIKRIKIMHQNISLTLGEKKCIGHFKDGRYVRCPASRTVESGWHCNGCKIEDDFFFCIQCDGSECINQKQREGCKETLYFIYLAAFDSILKVGISNEKRLLERLIEQGADFGAKIAIVKDGKDVRVIEQEISGYLGIADRVTGEQKQRLIFGNPNLAVTNILRAISKLQNNGFTQLIPPEIYDLRGYYSLENVIYNPQKLSVEDGAEIKGEVVAAKGNILIFRDESRFLSVNAHDIIGREIALG